MNRPEAKAILELCRPGQPAASDPRVAEALALAQTDPELREWFTQQQAFDAFMSASLKSVPVPAHLRATLLATVAQPPAPKPSALARLNARLAAWLRTPIIPEHVLLNPPTWRRWPVRVAVALLAVLTLTPVVLTYYAPRPFARYVADVVDASWDEKGHLALRTNDLAAVRHWLAAQKVNPDFSIPPALERFSLHGARRFEWRGHPIAFLCYLDGPRHLHLLVSDQANLPDSPSAQQLEMFSCHGWTTFGWVQEGKAYVVSGFRMPEFIRRFRKDGRWLLEDGNSAAGEEIILGQANAQRNRPFTFSGSAVGGWQAVPVHRKTAG